MRVQTLMGGKPKPPQTQTCERCKHPVDVRCGFMSWADGATYAANWRVVECRACRWSVWWDMDKLQRNLELHPDTVVLAGPRATPRLEQAMTAPREYHRLREWTARAEGRCTRCVAQAEPGRALCLRHLERDRERQRAKR